MPWICAATMCVLFGIALWVGFILGKKTNTSTKSVSIAASAIAVLGAGITKTVGTQLQWPAVATVSVLVVAVVIISVVYIWRSIAKPDPELEIDVGPRDAPVNTWIQVMRDPSPSAPTYMKTVLVQYRQLTDSLRTQILDLETAIGACDPQAGLPEAKGWITQGKDIRGILHGIVCTLRAMRASAAKCK